MRMTSSLEAPPPETVTAERLRAAAAWKVIGAEPEDLVNDKAELDRLDRAIVATRKQAIAARNEAQATRAQLDQAMEERFPPSVVWGLGVVTLASLGGWIYNRRKLMGLHDAAPLLVVPPDAPASDFEVSELSVRQDEAGQWAAPPPGAPAPAR